MKKKYKPGKYKPPKKPNTIWKEVIKPILEDAWDFILMFIIIPFILLVVLGFGIAINKAWWSLLMG